MTCEDIRKHFAFLLYGELEMDEEELVESHLDSCLDCRAAFDRERALHRLLDSQQLEPTPFELRDARLRLSATLENEPRLRAGLLSLLKSWFSIPALAKPAGAVALVALGFFGARVVPTGGLPGLQTAGVFDPSSSRVRYVESAPSGEVQVVVDETRQRIFSGRLNDQRIRGLLLAAVRDPSDPGLRVESVQLLTGQPADDDIQLALVNALQHDTNAGVRLKALEGLKPFAAHTDVRKALSRALLSDDNPSIRAQAIDLLTIDNRGPQLAGTLQELLLREQNGYIRQRCEKALHAMNASAEVY